jgi:O-antigen/teichoic acid export membrane protein
MLGSASSAALVVGFPVLLRVTSSEDAYAQAAPLLLAVVLTRAPLLIPLNAYQGMAITHFVSHRAQGARPLLRVAGIIGVVGSVGAGAAALIGPWLMEIIFSEGYRVDPLVLAGLTLTAALLALLTLTGAATLALGGNRAYAAGWLMATVCATLALLLPGTIAFRTILALALGPTIGIAVHVAWARRALRTQL